jgi:hypothetical protein
MPETMITRLHARGFQFRPWTGNSVRLVTAFSTVPADVDAFIAAAREEA